jgi:hypothetical protein
LAVPFRSIAWLAATAATTAFAVWLWPASIHIVDWTGEGPQRVAVFAPFARLGWIAAVSLAGAIVLCLWPPRTSEIRTARVRAIAPLALLGFCSLPYLPWLPDRIPLLLIFAGPVRWVIVAAALTMVLSLTVRVSPRIGDRRRLPHRWIVVGAFVIYLPFGLMSLESIGLTGDEPHYLIISQSLLADGDLRIENNHRRAEYRAFTRETLPPDYLQRGKDGEIYSSHAPGLAALLLPAYAVGGAPGAIVMMALLAALATAAVYELGLIVGGVGAASATAVIVGLTVPFVPYAWSVFPDMAGAAIVAWAAVWVMQPGTVAPARWAMRGALIATLPWLHTKFVVFTAGFAVLFLWRVRRQVAAAVAFVAPIVAASVAWLLFFYVIYGTPNPLAPFGSYARESVKLAFVPRSVFGLLFDQKFGLLTYAPIYAIVPFGVALGVRHSKWRWEIASLTAIAATFVLSSARFYVWWGGWSAPARYLVPVLPLVAPAIAVALVHAQRKWWQWVIAGLFLYSVIVSFTAAFLPDRLLLFSDAHGVSRMAEAIQGSAPLTATLPTFTESQWQLRDLNPRAYSGATRAATVIRGRVGLLDAFDPLHRQPYDYAAARILTRDEWMRAGAITSNLVPPGWKAPAPDTGIYPEGDLFWTKATERARVFVAAKGRSALTVTVHIGPAGGTVELRAAGVGHVLAMAPNETRSVEFAVVPLADWVALSIRASRAFRPADIDPQSGDQRMLGCQVRVTLRW